MASSLIEVLRAATQSGATEVVMETGQPILYTTDRGTVPQGEALTESELFELLMGVLDDSQQVDLAVGNVVEFELASDPGAWHVLTEPGPEGVSVRARQAGQVQAPKGSRVDLPPAAPFSDPGDGAPSGPQPVPTAVPDPMDDPFAAPVAPPPPASDESAFGTPAAANDPPDPPDPGDPLVESEASDFAFVDPFAPDPVSEAPLASQSSGPTPKKDDATTVRDAPVVPQLEATSVRESSPRMTLTDMGQFSAPGREGHDTRKTRRENEVPATPEDLDVGTRRDMPLIGDEVPELDVELDLGEGDAGPEPTAEAGHDPQPEAAAQPEAEHPSPDPDPGVGEAVPEPIPAKITAELSGFSELPAGVAEQLEQVPPASVCFVHAVHAEAVAGALGEAVLVGEDTDATQLARDLATQRVGVAVVVGVDDTSLWLSFILRRVEEGRRVFIETWATTPEGARRILLGAATPTRGEVWLDSHPQTSIIEESGAWELFPL